MSHESRRRATSSRIDVARSGDCPQLENREGLDSRYRACRNGLLRRRDRGLRGGRLLEGALDALAQAL